MIDKGKFYIDGKWINPVIKNNYQVINPSNETAYATISLGSKKDVDLAVTAARNAIDTWSNVDKKDKIYFLEKLPSEISLESVFIVFILSLIVSAIASYIPARHISKMKTFRALKYE